MGFLRAVGSGYRLTNADYRGLTMITISLSSMMLTMRGLTMITIVCGDVFAHNEGIGDDNDDRAGNSDSTRLSLTIMLTESSCWRRGGFLVGGDVFVNDYLHDATIVGV